MQWYISVDGHAVPVTCDLPCMVYKHATPQSQGEQHRTEELGAAAKQRNKVIEAAKQGRGVIKQ